MVQPRQRKHGLSSRAHAAGNRLVSEAPAHPCLRQTRPRRREQDSVCRIVANSPPRPAIPLPLLQALPAEQSLASAPPCRPIQAASTKILHSKLSPRDSPLQYSRNTLPPRANDSDSKDDCTLPLTLKVSNTQFPSSIFLRSVSVPDFCLCRRIPSRSYWSNNTSDPLVKSSHPWGPTTHVIAAWGNSTFVWEAS